MKRAPRWAGVAVLVVGGIALGTFFGIEEYGRSTPAAIGVAVVGVALIVVILRAGRRSN